MMLPLLPLSLQGGHPHLCSEKCGPGENSGRVLREKFKYLMRGASGDVYEVDVILHLLVVGGGLGP